MTAFSPVLFLESIAQYRRLARCCQIPTPMPCAWLCSLCPSLFGAQIIHHLRRNLSVWFGRRRGRFRRLHGRGRRRIVPAPPCLLPLQRTYNESPQAGPLQRHNRRPRAIGKLAVDIIPAPCQFPSPHCSPLMLADVGRLPRRRSLCEAVSPALGRCRLSVRSVSQRRPRPLGLCRPLSIRPIKRPACEDSCQPPELVCWFSSLSPVTSFYAHLVRKFDNRRPRPAMVR